MIPLTSLSFDTQDFDALTVPGLGPRMEAIIGHVRPKLHALGDAVAPSLSALCGEPMFPHVAKHARRSVNPPDDTWVAWSRSNKGYKAHPHFQVGLWSTHLFVQFALIYESTGKAAFAEALERESEKLLKSLPLEYFWSTDHMKPEGTLNEFMTEESLKELAHKLKHVKKAEALCGLKINRDNPVLQDGEKLLSVIEHTFETLVPLYRLS